MLAEAWTMSQGREMHCKLQIANCKLQIKAPALTPRQFAICNLGFARLVCICCTLLATLATGCSLGKQSPVARATTQPATSIDPKSAQPDYWLKQPAVARAVAKDFDELWNASRDALVDDGFTIDRIDYREGTLTTLPLISKQAYEFWRNDVVDARDLAQSSLGTMRRTVWLTIKRLPDGAFDAAPKVVVERYATVERRITSAAQYRDIFSIRLVDVSRDVEQTGMAIPAEYYYAIGRDHALEKQLMQSVQNRLRQIALSVRSNTK